MVSFRSFKVFKFQFNLKNSSAYILQMPKRLEILLLFLVTCCFTFCYDVQQEPVASPYCFVLLYFNFMFANGLLLLVIIYHCERLAAEKVLILVKIH